MYSSWQRVKTWIQYYKMPLQYQVTHPYSWFSLLPWYVNNIMVMWNAVICERTTMRNSDNIELTHLIILHVWVLSGLLRKHWTKNGQNSYKLCCVLFFVFIKYCVPLHININEHAQIHSYLKCAIPYPYCFHIQSLTFNFMLAWGES